MPRFYDTVDLSWGDDGDFVIDESGDLKSNTDDTIASTIAEVRSILRSEFNDWEKYPSYAAHLVEFIGESLNPALARRVEERIKSSLHINHVVDASDIYVRAVPVKTDMFLVILTIKAIPAATNSLEESGTTTLAFSLNVTTGNVFVVSQTEHDRGVVNLFPRRETP